MLKVFGRVTLAILLSAVVSMMISCSNETSSNNRSESSWQTHRYTKLINESMEAGGMDKMTGSERSNACNALRPVGYDPNVYLDRSMAGQGAGSESINFRREFIIGVLMITGTPDGIRDYCQ